MGGEGKSPLSQAVLGYRSGLKRGKASKSGGAAVTSALHEAILGSTPSVICFLLQVSVCDHYHRQYHSHSVFNYPHSLLLNASSIYLFIY